jgi:hypothetical protein
MRRVLGFFEKVPDRFYPFPVRVNDRLVFFKQAYDARLSQAIERWGHEGAQRRAWGLILWRQVWHVAGALAFLALLNALLLPDKTRAALVLSAAFVAYFFWQEFFHQRKHLGQIYSKAALDWGAWAAPVALFWTAAFF